MSTVVLILLSLVLFPVAVVATALLVGAAKLAWLLVEFLGHLLIFPVKIALGFLAIFAVAAVAIAGLGAPVLLVAAFALAVLVGVVAIPVILVRWICGA